MQSQRSSPCAVSRQAALASSGNLLDMQTLGTQEPNPRPNESENLRVGSSDPVF